MAVPPLDDDPARRQAEAWFVRMNGAPTRADRLAFDAWRQDPAHRAAFAAAEAAWRRSEAAAAALAREEADALASLLARMRAPAPRGWRPRIAIAGLCLSLLAGGAWLERPNLLQNALADVATGRGERRLVSLPDGSTALLDADSAIDLRFGATERRVALLRGAAFFSVRTNGQPFTVEAAGGEARVLGTSFAMALAAGSATVTVATGRVEVQPPVGPAAILGGGQQLRFGPQGGGPVAGIDLAEALAWREGRLAFHQAPLREVVEAIGRHRQGRIVILDAALAERRVTGSFAAADTEAALGSLQSILGFRRQDITAHLVTLR